MRILIYGAGVIGSIIGGKLAASGVDVTVLARGHRLKELQDKGIVLLIPGSGQEEIIPVSVIEELSADDEYDYILVTMQRTQVEDVLPDLASNCSKNIVFMVNTAGGYEHWMREIGEERLIAGFPSAGGERLDGRVTYFIGKGIMRLFQTTTFGEPNGIFKERTRKLIRTMRRAGIPSVYCANMDAWQKTHVAMVTSIGNALYSFDCDNYALSKSHETMGLMVRGIKEGLAVLQRLGLKTTPAKLTFLKLPTFLVTFAFECFMPTRLAETVLAKHCKVAKSEMTKLQEEFDALIALSKMPTPSIDKLKMDSRVSDVYNEMIDIENPTEK